MLSPRLPNNNSPNNPPLHQNLPRHRVTFKIGMGRDELEMDRLVVDWPPAPGFVNGVWSPKILPHLLTALVHGALQKRFSAKKRFIPPPFVAAPRVEAVVFATTGSELYMHADEGYVRHCRLPCVPLRSW